MFVCLRCQSFVKNDAFSPMYQYACTKCGQVLFYLGKEQAVLSDSILFDKNVELPSTQTKETQKSFTFSSLPKPVEVCECEDELTYNPDNQEALLFLARYYRSQLQLEAAKTYYFKLLVLQDDFIAVHYELTEIFLYEEKYHRALESLELIQLIEGETKENIYLKKLLKYFLK